MTLNSTTAGSWKEILKITDIREKNSVIYIREIVDGDYLVVGPEREDKRVGEDGRNDL